MQSMFSNGLSVVKMALDHASDTGGLGILVGTGVHFHKMSESRTCTAWRTVGETGLVGLPLEFAR